MATPSVGPDVCSRDPRADRWTGEPAEIQSILSHTLLGILFHCGVTLLDPTFCVQLTLIISHVISRLRVLICWAALGPRHGAKPSGTSSGEYWGCWCPLISGWGRSSGGGCGNPLQYSWLGESQGQRSLVGYSPWGHEELDMADRLNNHNTMSFRLWLSWNETWLSRLGLIHAKYRDNYLIWKLPSNKIVLTFYIL